MNTIFVSQGMKRYTGGTITETLGKDISAATFTIALNTDPLIPPAAALYVPADQSIQGTTNASRKITKLIDSNTPLGAWCVWGRIGDSPEIEAVLLQRIVVA